MKIKGVFPSKSVVLGQVVSPAWTARIARMARTRATRAKRDRDSRRRMADVLREVREELAAEDRAAKEGTP